MSQTGQGRQKVTPFRPSTQSLAQSRAPRGSGAAIPDRLYAPGETSATASTSASAASACSSITDSLLPSTDGPTSCLFGKEEERLHTLRWFPARLKKLAPALARSGFYCTGQRDVTTCVSCGITLQDWTPESDPFRRHEEASPGCPYASQSAVGARESHATDPTDPEPAAPDEGDSGIAVHHSNGTHGHKATDKKNKTKWIEKTRGDWREDPCARAVLDMGKSEALVRQALFNQKRKGVSVGVEELLEDVFVLEDESRQLASTEKLYKHPDLAELYAINRSLVSASTCILCRQQSRDLLMLPCKHLVACESCGEEVIQCPECQHKILATVKIYLCK